MLIRIDPSSDVALVAQLSGSLRADMAAGRVRPGERLPAARDLAASLGVNLHTVLRAYQDLRDEGLLDMRRGRGAVVTEAAAALGGLEQQIRELGVTAAALGMTPDALAALVRDTLRAPKQGPDAGDVAASPDGRMGDT